MKAVISVIGRDQVGILAFVSTECAKRGVNIEDVNQTILDGLFTMIMVVSFKETTASLKELSEALSAEGKKRSLEISVMHEGIFNSMHRI